MSGRVRRMPPHYPSLPFHGIRAISFISASIVAGILVYFIIQLKTDGFKIPWTFLVVLLASGLNLVVLALTALIHCCGRLSPLLNALLNIPILFLWGGALGLLGDNIVGTLSHSCSTSVWGNSTGVSICSTYKAMFAFMIFATIAQIAQIVLDIRTRINQTRSGAYQQMGNPSDLKLEPIASTQSLSRSVDIPYAPHEATTRDEPGWRPGHRYKDTDGGQVHGRPPLATQQNDSYGSNNGQPAIHMDDFHSRVPDFGHATYPTNYSDSRY